MKNKVLIIAAIAIVMVLMLKFVGTGSLKTSDAFGAANIYTDNKSFVDSASGANLSRSNWFGEINQVVGEAMAGVVSVLTNNQLLATGVVGPVTNLAVAYMAVVGDSENVAYNINDSQNVAMANLD